MPGVDVYGRGDAAAIPDLYAIDSVVMLDGNQSYPLGRIPEAWIEAADSPTSASRPCSYSYFDGSLRLWPIPSDAWTIRIAAHLRLDVPTDDAAPSPWFDEARDLISARTKWHLALHVLRDPALKAAMDVAAADAFTTLKGRANGIASSGRIEAYDL
ncbi:hypothetical protein [Methylobacterium sp. sgz302541]|uniref:hypothetical protein n=1 Tax=unclassified Methylobacterium TaxID=2615210 RepID=UPI003D32D439